MEFTLFPDEQRFCDTLEAAARAVLCEARFLGRVAACLVGVPACGTGPVMTYAGEPLDLAAPDRIDSTDGAGVEEALNDKGVWRYFAASRPALLAGHAVFPVLAVEAEPLDLAPALRDRGSFADHLIRQVLRQAQLRLAAGADWQELPSLTFETLRAAAARFVGAALDPAPPDPDVLLTRIAALPYEGREGRGLAIVAAPGDPDVRVALRLVHQQPLTHPRAVRKLLEATTADSGLLVHRHRIWGIGTVPPDGEHTAVAFTGRGHWQLRQGRNVLLDVTDGTARQGTPVDIPLDWELPAALDRLLPGADVAELQRLARAARHHRHGALLVISADAAAEARRLHPHAWATHPAPLDDEMMARLTAMDGGVLVDRHGRCHAIGVIPDGPAGGAGDPSRGSRYNNPLRYLRNAATPPAVVIVYSADGSVDVLA